MRRNIISRRITRRIASGDLVVLILVDSHVVEPHGRRHQRPEPSQVQLREAVTHTKVEDHRHWFFGDDSLTDIAIWSKSPRIEIPRLLRADKPRRVASRPRFVFESVDLVAVVIIPVVVEISDTRDGLLVNTTLVRIHGRQGIVVQLDEI